MRQQRPPAHVVVNGDAGDDEVVLARPVEPLLVERRFESQLDERLMGGHDAVAWTRRSRTASVASTGRPVGIGGRVAGQVERRQGDLGDPEVVGVRVHLLRLRVGHDDLRPHPPYDLDQPADGLVEVGAGERVGMMVGLRLGHARVAVAES